MKLLIKQYDSTLFETEITDGEADFLIEKLNSNRNDEKFKSLPHRIKDLRTDLGLNMDEFGKLFDPPASKGAVSNWENGYNLPNNKRIKDIKRLINSLD